MKRPLTKRGFTLVELMVSLSIFSIIIVVIAGAYLTVVSIDRQTRGLNELVNNLSFVTDSMSRAIRTGTDYCGADSGNGSCTPVSGNEYSSFFFTDQNGCGIEYILNGDQIVENENGGSSCQSISNEPITESGIKITNLKFYVYNPGNGNGQQAFVVYTISGTLQSDAKHTQSFTIETAATQRAINI